MRCLLLATLVAFSAACGAYHFPGSGAGPTGTVTGRVVAVPCAPVESAPKSCAGRPVSGLQINFQNGAAAASTVTDSTGNYSIDLQPGSWKVGMKTYMRLISGPTSINVTAGSTIVANYVLDSGIRLPAPQQ